MLNSISWGTIAPEESLPRPTLDAQTRVDTSWDSSVLSRVHVLLPVGKVGVRARPWPPPASQGLLHVSCSGSFTSASPSCQGTIAINLCSCPYLCQCVPTGSPFTGLSQHTLECWLVLHLIDVRLVHVSNACTPPRGPRRWRHKPSVTGLFPLVYLSHRIDVSLHP